MISTIEKESDFYFAIAYCNLFGIKKIEEIRIKFGSLKTAWFSTKPEWQGMKDSLINKFFIFKKNFSLENTKKYLEENKINYVLFDDNNYPTNLKNISFPPPIIFYLGNINILEKQKNFTLAIVGSRASSPYGQKVLSDLIEGLDERFLIVSGLALGTDAYAHQKALEKKIKTGAVLGGPIEKGIISCPATNYWLAQEILKNDGFILSEFPPFSPILKSNFPRRNRIIAGLSIGTLVIEAGQKSGASKTAEYAKDANRVVMAVPGSIYSELSVGTNNLLKDHVDLVSEPQDIYRCLDIEPLSQNNKQQKNEQIIKKAFELAGDDACKIVKTLILLNKIANTNEISAICQLDTPRVHSKLTILELSGIIKRNNSGKFFLL